MNAHRMMVLAGVACLIALAFLLWEPEPEADPLDTACWGSWDHDTPPEPVQAPRVVAWAGGRTTIEPLVSDAYLRRREAA